MVASQRLFNSLLLAAHKVIVNSAEIQTRTAQMANLTVRCIKSDPVVYSNFKRIAETPEVKMISEIFKNSGHEIRIAGGAVRDLLSGDSPHDVDFASTATPQQMIEFLRSVSCIPPVTMMTFYILL